MPAAKTFETIFKIGARFTGGPAFNAANRAINAVERNARGASGKIHRMFTGVAAGAKRMRGAIAVGGGVLGGLAISKAISGVTEGFQASIDAALEVEKVHERLGLTLERNAQRWNLNEKQIKLQQQAMIAMGDSMAELGVDGETVVTMLDKVSQSVDPRALGNYKKGLTDLLIAQKGVNASEEHAAALGSDVAKLIEFKMPKALKQFKGVTEDQIKAYSKLETREQRQIWFFKNIARETGATEKAFATSQGKAQKFRNMLEDVAETIGKPFVALRGQFSETGIAILTALQPKIDIFSEKLKASLENVSKWWSEHQVQVVAALDKVGDAIIFVVDHWKEFGRHRGGRRLRHGRRGNRCREFGFDRDPLADRAGSFSAGGADCSRGCHLHELGQDLREGGRGLGPDQGSVEHRSCCSCRVGPPSRVRGVAQDPRDDLERCPRADHQVLLGLAGADPHGYRERLWHHLRAIQARL
jgi:hypothetical protein